ncbi:MAG TPA: hypothetical protein VEW03_04155, partial [Longimicrobiaceae bacterium]|nr:hypothetical protein [Longimicrobiaceae bacterium]
NLLGTLGIVSGCAVAWLEGRLRHHRDPRYPEGRIKLWPRAFENPEHHTVEGRVLQTRSRRLLLAMYVLFACGSLTKCAGTLEFTAPASGSSGAPAITITPSDPPY